MDRKSVIQFRRYLEEHPVSSDLLEYREWWMSTQEIKQPINPLYFDCNAILLTLHQSGCFQTQLFISNKGVIIPPHCHPHVETILSVIDVDGVVSVGSSPESMITVHSGMFDRVDPKNRFYWLDVNTFHSGYGLSRHAVHYVHQKWLSGEPKQIAEDWLGEDGSVSPRQGDRIRLAL